jgi:nitrogen fixation negative regulator NifL
MGCVMDASLLSEPLPLTEKSGELLLKRPALLMTAVEQSSVAMSISDPHARILYCNPAFQQLTGYSVTELTGCNHRILSSQQTPRHVYRQMWNTILQGLPWSGQLINRRKDGSLYLAELTISPVFGAQGEIEHFLAMHKDISESYVQGQRLRNQMTLLEAVLNNIPAAVLVVDNQHQVLIDNLSYKTLCADCGGRELLSELGYPQQLAMLQSGTPVPLVIHGKTRWFSFGCWALPDVNEEASRYFTATAPPRTLIMITDCSEQRHVVEQQRLEQLRQELNNGKVLTAIRETLDAALVQLNGPLNMLAAALRLDPEGERPGIIPLQAALHEGRSAVQRLKACRPSLDEEPASRWVVDPLLRDLHALYVGRFSGLGELCYLPGEMPLFVYARRKQILSALCLWLDHTLQLCHELLAHYHRPFKLHVQVDAYCRDGWLCLQVDDNIPMQQLRYACAPMLAMNTLGQGMELRLIQALVAHHQGTIDLTVNGGQGSRLIMRLPLFNALL